MLLYYRNILYIFHVYLYNHALVHTATFMVLTAQLYHITITYVSLKKTAVESIPRFVRKLALRHTKIGGKVQTWFFDYII